MYEGQNEVDIDKYEAAVRAMRGRWIHEPQIHQGSRIQMSFPQNEMFKYFFDLSQAFFHVLPSGL